MKILQYFLLPIIGVFFSFSLPAQVGVHFEKSDFSTALAKANAEDKLLFVDAYTDWCGPCKWMTNSVFPDSAVGELFNSHFVSIKIDMEKGEGPELAKKYQVRAYPSLMFINGEGELVEKVVGGRPVAALLSIGERVVDGVQPITALTAVFEAGDYDRKWLFDYIMRLTDAGMDVEAPLEIFRAGMEGEKLLQADNWAVFDRHFRRIDTPEFEYVMANLDRFRSEFGKETVDNKLGANYSMALFSAINEEQFDRYDSLRTVALAIGIKNADQQIISIDMRRYRKQLPAEGYALMIVGMVESGKSADANSLNSYAWEFYESQDDPKMLELALGWAEKSIELDKNSMNMDTYGMLLFKTGQSEKAVKTCEEAMELAKAEGIDPKPTQEEMEKWLAKLAQK